MPNNKVLVIESGKDLDCLLGEGIESRDMDAIMCTYSDDIEDIIRTSKFSEAYLVINKKVIDKSEECEKHFQKVLSDYEIPLITVFTSMPTLEEIRNNGDWQ